jgi:hypothetical protein
MLAAAVLAPLPAASYHFVKVVLAAFAPYEPLGAAVNFIYRLRWCSLFYVCIKISWVVR